MRLAGVLTASVLALVLGAGALSAQGAGYRFIADSTFYYKTGRQAEIPAGFNFNEPKELEKFPLAFGEWEGVDLPVVNRPVVKPDFMFERNYWNKNGESVWFQLIRGRIERAVHVPAICYYNAGWQIQEHAADSVRAGNHSIPCGRMALRKGDREAVELYFYLWADPKRDFMKGCVMVRVASIGPVGSQKDRLELVRRFVRDIFEQVGRMP